MAFPVAVRSTGTLITASIWNADLKDNLNTLRAGGFALTSQATLDGMWASSTTAWSRVGLASKQSQRVNLGATAHEAFVAPQVYAITKADVINTSVETTTLSWTVPANEMVDGDVIEVDMAVLAKNNTGGGVGITVKWFWGATSITGGTDTWSDNATEEPWLVGFKMQRVATELFVQRRATASAFYYDHNAGYLNLTDGSVTGNAVRMSPTFSGSQTVALKITFATASSLCYWKTVAARVQRKPNG